MNLPFLLLICLSFLLFLFIYNLLSHAGPSLLLHALSASSPCSWMVLRTLDFPPFTVPPSGFLSSPYPYVSFLYTPPIPFPPFTNIPSVPTITIFRLFFFFLSVHPCFPDQSPTFPPSRWTICPETEVQSHQWRTGSRSQWHDFNVNYFFLCVRLCSYLLCSLNKTHFLPLNHHHFNLFAHFLA